MNKKIFSFTITIILFAGIMIVLFGLSKNNTGSPNLQYTQNVEVKDGIQHITINARGGYLPAMSSAKANIPTKLIFRTNGTYDCSAALVIKSIGYQKILPPTGEEIIDMGLPNIGTLHGSCSMGMYSFVINFE